MKLATAILGLSVATLITLSFCVIILDETPELRIDKEGWYYDDYKPASGSESVTGAFEIVTINNVEYIHAKDVGAGTIDGKSYYVNKAKLDLAFMCGQSNAAYRNADPSAVDPVPLLGTAYYFGLEDRSGPLSEQNDTGLDISSCAIWSMIDTSTGSLRIGDKAPSYAATYYAETGHKVLWVCGAIGNKALFEFLPDDGFMWIYQNDILSAALSAVDKSKFDLSTNYYLWCQGEANASTPVSTYIAQFITYNNAMMAGDCAGVKFDGAVISVTRSVNGGNSTIAQLDLADTYSTIHIGTMAADSFTVANGLMGSDDLHYSQLGNNILGADLADSVVAIVFKDTSLDKTSIDILELLPYFLIISLILAAVAIIIKSKY